VQFFTFIGMNFCGLPKTNARSLSWVWI